MIGIIRRSDIVAKAVDRFEEQYGGGLYPHHKAKIPELRALPKDGRYSENIDKIIGNDSWTKIECDECGERKEILVTIGVDREWDCAAASVCEECVSKAVNLLIKSAP